MSNYFIYKLCCDDCDEIYVGSTKAYRERESDVIKAEVKMKMI